MGSLISRISIPSWAAVPFLELGLAVLNEWKGHLIEGRNVFLETGSYIKVKDRHQRIVRH